MPHPASVRKLWGYCNVLGDDWMSYGDCAEQLTYLLFLKMADVGRGLSLRLTRSAAPSLAFEGSVNKPRSGLTRRPSARAFD